MEMLSFRTRLNILLFVFYQALKGELEKKQAELDSLENSGQWLIDNSEDDPKVTPDVHTKINDVRTNLDKLLSKIQARQARLDKVLFESQEFNAAFDSFMEKLVTIEEAVAKQRPVSAVYDTVKIQTKDNKVCRKKIYKTIMDLKE